MMKGSLEGDFCASAVTQVTKTAKRVRDNRMNESIAGVRVLNLTDRLCDLVSTRQKSWLQRAQFYKLCKQTE